MQENIPVGDLGALKHLVKEFEILRRRRGREFFISLGNGGLVTNEVSLNERGEVLVREEGAFRAFAEVDLAKTKLGQAMCNGTLFTQDVYASRMSH